MSLASDDIIPLNPVFLPKIWGGRRLASAFGYDIPQGSVGECWAVSAHQHGDCRAALGAYAGRTLSELWEEEPQLFGAAGGRFPLLVKILDVNDWLSVQVHPDDAYAAEHEGGSLGKSECWYVLEADRDARIMIGTPARSREEFAQKVGEGRWSELLHELPIHPGDFFAIRPGTVHAVRGALILEVQQSSDVTYRIYDFDRQQADGTYRELHLDKALDVIDYKASLYNSGAVTASEVDGITKLMSCEYFDVLRARAHEGASVALPCDGRFMTVSVVEGEGALRVPGCPAHAVHKGFHCIVPATAQGLELSGTLEALVGRPV